MKAQVVDVVGQKAVPPAQFQAQMAEAGRQPQDQLAQRLGGGPSLGIMLQAAGGVKAFVARRRLSGFAGMCYNLARETELPVRKSFCSIVPLKRSWPLPLL